MMLTVGTATYLVMSATTVTVPDSNVDTTPDAVSCKSHTYTTGDNEEVVEAGTVQVNTPFAPSVMVQVNDAVAEVASELVRICAA